MKKELLVFGSLLCLMSGIGAVRAQTCATPPSCASLGYTMTSSECSGQPTLVCPFDASAVFCAGTASSGGAGGSTGGGAGSGLIESCNGDCFVGYIFDDMNGNNIKLIQKYKFVDGGSNNTECENLCRQNGMSHYVYGTQFDSRILCVEANKTSGSYFYYRPLYANRTSGSYTKINCSNFQISSSSTNTIGASTGCLCAKIIG